MISAPHKNWTAPLYVKFRYFSVPLMNSTIAIQPRQWRQPVAVGASPRFRVHTFAEAPTGATEIRKSRFCRPCRGYGIKWNPVRGLTARSGVTLIEVLMSLMIMSIGVTSVMVLFPIAVLRSIQSTQLTNAAILKYNVEAQLRGNPKVIFDPDGNLDLATTDAQRQQALSEHYQTAAFRNYIVDPVGFHAFFGVDNNGDSTVGPLDDAWARSFGNNGTAPAPPQRSLILHFEDFEDTTGA